MKTDKNQCVAEERLVDFALMPFNDNNTDTAGHIFVCSNCAKKLRSILDVMMSKAQNSMIDFETVNNFWQKQTQKQEEKINLWDKLRYLLNLNTQIDFSISTFTKVSALTSFKGTCADKCNERLQKNKKTDIELCFTADCDNHDPFYWQAILLLKNTTEGQDKLSIYVTDNTSEPISIGKLLFQESVIPIIDGYGDISMKQFQNGLKNPSVAFQFISGKCMDGDLTFLKPGDLK